jgi:hypothetical protein
MRVLGGAHGERDFGDLAGREKEPHAIVPYPFDGTDDRENPFRPCHGSPHLQWRNFARLDALPSQVTGCFQLLATGPHPPANQLEIPCGDIALQYAAIQGDLRRPFGVSSVSVRDVDVRGIVVSIEHADHDTEEPG